MSVICVVAGWFGLSLPAFAWVCLWLALFAVAVFLAWRGCVWVDLVQREHRLSLETLITFVVRAHIVCVPTALVTLACLVPAVVPVWFFVLGLGTMVGLGWFVVTMCPTMDLRAAISFSIGVNLPIICLAFAGWLLAS